MKLASLLRRATGLALLIFAPILHAAYDLPLQTGWNLVSLPEQQLNPDITAVTRSLQGRLLSVWSYAEDGWQAYFPGSPASSLTRMDAGRAYWVQLSAPANLVGAGLKPSGILSLAAGWNFIGCNSATARSLVQVFGTGTPGITSVQTYDRGAWRTFVPGAAGNTVTQLETGRGYWVQATRALTADFGLVLDSQLRVFDAAAAQAITAVSPTSVTVGLAAGGALVVNNILSVPPVPLAPQGLLRRITAITRTATSVTLTTTNAAPGDAIVNGVIAASVPLASSLVDSLAAQAAGPDGRPRAAALQEGESAALDTLLSTAELGGTIELPALRLSLNRSVDLIAGSVSLQGQFVIEPQFGVNIEFENRAIKSCRVFVQGRQSLDFSATATAPSNLSGSFTRNLFERKPLTPIMIGVIPVVPSWTLSLSFSGQYSATAATRITEEANLLIGVNYERGVGFTPITNFQGSASLGTQTTVASTLALTIGPQFSVEIAGIGGPFFGVGGGVSFEAQTTNNTSTWGVYGIANFEAGLSVGGLFGSGISWTPISLPLLRVRLFPSGEGTVAGQVVDARGPLSGVTVAAVRSITPLGEDLPAGTPVTTDAAGNYSLRLPVNNGYRLHFSKTGYITQRVAGADVLTNATTSLAPVYLDTSTQPGTVRGVVTSATTGLPVANVLLTLRPSVLRDNVELAGTVAVASTDSAGRYEVRNLEPGYYTAQLTASGYIPGTLTALARAGATNEGQNGTLSPRLDEREWRIVLSWGSSPSDLDSHLTGPIAGSSSRFHVYYDAKGSRTASPFASLDIDDTTGFGPETMTLVRTIDGTYRYSVHNYSNRSTAGSTALAGSSARVNVFRGNTQLRSYNVPGGAGTLWTVFEIRDGTLVDVNSMTSTSSPTSIQSEYATGGALATTDEPPGADDAAVLALTPARKQPGANPDPILP